MKRRNFFKNAALAGAGLGLVSLKANARSTGSLACTPRLFSDLQTVVSGSENILWELIFCLNSAKTPESAPAEDKGLIFRMRQTKNEVAKVYEAKYEIQSSKAIDGSTTIKTVTAVQTTVTKSEFTPSSALNLKKLVFRYDFTQAFGKIELLDAKGALHRTIHEYDDTYDDCFLTTACTAFLNKPDNCPELKALRIFRDTELVNNADGRKLVDEYYAIAPQIVQNIAHNPKKEELFNAIYKDMILPTLERINAGDKQGAIEVYKSYTYKLKAEFGA